VKARNLDLGLLSVFFAVVLYKESRRNSRQLKINNGEIHDYSVPARHCPRCVFNKMTKDDPLHGSLN
jgi:hypothetical protein